MLSKRPAPVIGRLSNTVMSGGMWDSPISLKSPSEFKILSPRGPINCDLTGVGLGIVAAMEKHADEIKTQVPANCRRKSGRSSPIPVNCGKNLSLTRGSLETEERESLEDFTFVSGVGKDNKPFSRVYYDGGCENRRLGKKDDDLRRSKRIYHNHDHQNKPSMFTVSPARFGDFPASPAPDFLSSCHMCQKKLHGKDIYMYRGEKAFCSPECRCRQIVIDEKKEKYCGVELASRSSVEVSSSPCNYGRTFSPGILAI